MDDKMSDSSGGSTSSTSASEGEYTLPDDERSDDSLSTDKLSVAATSPYYGPEQSLPVFDIGSWKPDPPAGLQFLNLVPINDSNYELASSIVQHDLLGKVTATAQHRKNRHRDFLKGKTICNNIVDEKRFRNAISSGNYDLVEELLDSGVDPSCTDDKKRSPLHLAAALGSKQIVELLLDRGADPNQKDVIGNTALHLAACTNQFHVVTLLLKAGTDINAADNSGHTPLHLARSRLRLIQNDNATYSEKTKHEVSNIIGMMKEYVNRSGPGQEDHLSQLDQLCCRLHQTSTKEEMDVIGHLLSDFAELQIQRSDHPG